MTDYTAYFLNGNQSVVRLDTLEISHQNMSQTYRMVRNNRDGIQATIEDGSTQTFQWYPFRLKDSAIKNSLDYELQIILGDLGEIMPMEIERIRAANNMVTPPTVIYRAYASDDLTEIMVGPLTLQMQNPSTERRGTSFSAKPLNANDTSTGLLYTFSRFPMLRGTL